MDRSVSVIDEIESLFVVRKFDEALDKCEQELRHLKRLASQPNGASVAGVGAANQVDGQVVDSTTLNLVEESLPLVQLMIQLLFETKRSNEIMPFVRSFYGDEVEGVPLDVVTLCISLQISLQNFEKASEMIDLALERFHDTTSPKTGPSECTEERYIQLKELKAVQILAAQNKFSEAEEYIIADPYLSESARSQILSAIREKQQQSNSVKGDNNAESQSASAETSPSVTPPPTQKATDHANETTSLSDKSTTSNGHKRDVTRPYTTIITSLWGNFYKVVLNKYNALPDTERRTLYGVVLLLVLAGLFFLSSKWLKRAQRMTLSVLGAISKWMSEVGQMITSVNGTRRSQQREQMYKFGSQTSGLRSRL